MTKVTLPAAIAQLRRDILDARDQRTEGQPIFLIEQIDVEFQMVAETTITAEVGAEGKTGNIVSFFLADASASAKASGERNWGNVHTVKIRMSIDGAKSDRTVGSTGSADQ